MRIRRWLYPALAVTALAGGLGALLVLFDQTPAQARGHRTRHDRASESLAPPEPARAEPERRSGWAAHRRVPRAVAPQAASRPPTTEIARLRGVVIVPRGSEVSVDELRVRADDGTRVLEARAGDEPGSFAFDLRPGRYTLTAELGDFMGVVEEVLAIADDEREVSIALEPAGPIEGRLSGVLESDGVTLQAFRAGTRVAAGQGQVEGVAFSIHGLRAGQLYDLEFAGEWFSEVTLRGVRAPVEGLEVALGRFAALRGAFGLAPGDRCPIEHATFSTSADDATTQTSSSSVQSDCRFEFPIPRGAREVKIAVTGPGWDLEQRVAVPSEGDPELVCFHPPCSEAPVGSGPEPDGMLTVHHGCRIPRPRTPFREPI